MDETDNPLDRKYEAAFMDRGMPHDPEVERRITSAEARSLLEAAKRAAEPSEHDDSKLARALYQCAFGADEALGLIKAHLEPMLDPDYQPRDFLKDLELVAQLCVQVVNSGALKSVADQHELWALWYEMVVRSAKAAVARLRPHIGPLGFRKSIHTLQPGDLHRIFMAILSPVARSEFGFSDDEAEEFYRAYRSDIRFAQGLVDEAAFLEKLRVIQELLREAYREQRSIQDPPMSLVRRLFSVVRFRLRVVWRKVRERQKRL